MVVSFLLAFLVCGTICMISQIIIDHTRLTPGHITSLFVVFGAILEFFNLYQYIRKIGGMGAALPICSFGSVMMKGVKEGVLDSGFMGIFKGVFANCGGLIALAVFLAFLSTIFFKPKA